MEPHSLSIQVRNVIGKGDYVGVEWIARTKTVSNYFLVSLLDIAAPLQG
jgi:hypothetical protein